MKYIYRIFLRDIFSLFCNRKIIAFIFIVPPVLLILVGGLHIKSDDINIRVLMQQDLTKNQREDIKNLFGFFGAVSLSFDEDDSKDPLNILKTSQLDLLVIAGEDGLIYYTAETDHDRLNYLRQQVAAIETVREEGMEFLFTKETDDIAVNPLVVFFLPPHGRDLFAVPRLLAIFTCFFPFLLASGTIIQERDEHSLETLLVSLKSQWYKLILGKTLLPLFTGLFHFLLLTLIVQMVFGLYIKSGFSGILAVQTIAAISSLMIGLSISCIVSSQLYALTASAIYLLCLILLTGFIFPLDTASPMIQVLSHFFPLTFTLNSMESWIFSGYELRHHLAEMGFLSVQMLIYSVLAFLMVNQLKKNM